MMSWPAVDRGPCASEEGGGKLGLGGAVSGAGRAGQADALQARSDAPNDDRLDDDPRGYATRAKAMAAPPSAIANPSTDIGDHA